MAESSSQNPSSPKITPKEEPDTQERPESPNPFLPVDQVKFTFDEITFSNNSEYTAKTLEDSKIWVSTPTGGIRGDIDYAKLIWEDIIHKLNKKTRKKVVPCPRFISLLLEYMMPEYDNEELTINPTQAICNLDVPVDSKALKPSSQTEEVPQGKKPGAKSGLRRKQSSKHTSESKTEASKSKTGQ
ncbi:hypothetical protein Tco_1459412 [Tanacetum coccineum]